MNLTDELRKLSDLHQEGHLTDQEFTDAKKRLIEQSQESPVPAKPIVTTKPPIPFREMTFESRRWSAGNLFFPDTLTLASDGILFRKGALFGSREEHINYQAVASFKIRNGVFLSAFCIETSGGSQPIFMNGLWKSEAKEIQDTIRIRQKKGPN